MDSTDRWICNEELGQHIRLNLRAFDIHRLEGEALTAAAVAITVVDVGDGYRRYRSAIPEGRGEEAALVLTQRSLRLKDHAGQWALPGGRVEKGESPEDTALRELAEEVGLHLNQEQVMGRLDDFATRSGFIITPVVVWGGPGVDLRGNPDEVAAVHRIPVAEFMRPDAPLLEDMPESKHPVLRMPVGDSWISAPTAALLYQFREVAILGRDTRVAHYEQPYFAWK